MTTATTSRRVRKSATTPEVPESLKGVVVEKDAPAPKSVRASRRTATPAAPATKATSRRRPAGEKQADALVPAAAATIVGPDGITRHTEEYTVDLLEPGVETERDFDKLLTKDPSETHEAFVAWFEEHSGYKCDVRTVQFVIATWVADFQRSPEQKAKTIAKRLRVAAEKAEKAQNKK